MLFMATIPVISIGSIKIPDKIDKITWSLCYTLNSVNIEIGYKRVDQGSTQIPTYPKWKVDRAI